MGCEHLSHKLFLEFYFNSDIIIERHIWGINQSVNINGMLTTRKRFSFISGDVVRFVI